MGAGLLLWAISAILFGKKEFKTSIRYLVKDGDANKLVHDEKLPTSPMPVLVTENKSKSRWTVSIPPKGPFPLKANDYKNICTTSHDLVHHLDSMKRGRKGHGHFGYYHVDKRFMDVQQAEDKSMLPSGPPAFSGSFVAGVSKPDSQIDSKNRDPVTGICKRSITYVMETTDAGFGSTLMGLWMAYGLAKKEGRALFIDDRNW